jgi:hypothetical protein
VSRIGVEAKPPWRSVPLGVRRQVAEVLGAAVARGTRVWGGYGPTPTFRLTLTDGRRAFLKAANSSTTEFIRRALAQEERVYRELSDLIGPWAPRFYGAFHNDEWHVLLLEDVGPQSIPPWSSVPTRQITRAYAEFHAATLGQDLPIWLPRPNAWLHEVTWSAVAAESDGLRTLAALASAQAGVAHHWLHAALPVLARATDAAAELPGPHALLHLDTRSDNLRFTRGRLSLFDWPWAGVGRPEFDVVEFAQSVTVEGGVEPEQILAWYGERLALRPDALDAATAWLAAFFAEVAWRPDIPGLPRLRTFQRQQLSVVLPWAARRLQLPAPTWVSAIV